MNRRERRAMLFQSGAIPHFHEPKTSDQSNAGDVQAMQQAEGPGDDESNCVNQFYRQTETIIVENRVSQQSESVLGDWAPSNDHDVAPSIAEAEATIAEDPSPPHVLLDQERAEEIVKNATFFRSSKHFAECKGFAISAEKSIPNAFVRRVKFSGDGSFLATDSADNVIKLFDYNSITQSMENNQVDPVARIPTGGYVLDMKWHPRLPLLAVATHSSPIRVFSIDHTVDTVFVAKNAVDEHSTPTALEWISERELLAGFTRGPLRCFDINRPSKAVFSIQEGDKSSGNPIGKISCLANSNNGCYVAVGNYEGSVSIYSKSNSSYVASTNFRKEAVIDLRYSADDNMLFIAYQKVDAIYCLDLRNISDEYMLLKRPCESNQRISFDVDRAGKWLISGSVSNENGGEVYFFNLENLNSEPLRKLVTPNTAVSSTSIHPTQSFVAVGTGERIFPRRLTNFGLSDDSSSDDEGDNRLTARQSYLYKQNVNNVTLENSLYLYDLT